MGRRKDYSDMSLAERIGLVERIYIVYPRLQAILDRITERHEFSRISGESTGFFVTGPPGVGKTTLLRHYLGLHPRSRNEEGLRVPVLTCATPRPATAKSLAAMLLYNLGDPAASKGTTIGQTIRLYKLVEKCQVEFLILDEFQHFIDMESQRILLNVSDWLKNLLDETHLPMLLMGLPHSDEVLAANPQLERRFSSRQKLEPFSCKTTEEWNEFRSLLARVDELLPLNQSSHLADESMAMRLFYASRGVISSIMRIVRRATLLAIKGRNERLSMQLLSVAYKEELEGKSRPRPNPFDRQISWSDIEAEEFASFQRTIGGTNRRLKGKK
jgi:Cdc6-like AAA superfamily ATPase